MRQNRYRPIKIQDNLKGNSYSQSIINHTYPQLQSISIAILHPIRQQIKIAMHIQTSKLSDQLENEVTQLIKRMRQREQQHHQIYQYNNKVIASRHALEQDIYIHDQISKHRTFINQRRVIELAFNQNDQQLTALCHSIQQQGSQIMPHLIKRVSSRVLQIAYSGVDLMTEPTQYYLATYNKFKQQTLQTINSNQNLKLAELINLFCRYFHHKVSVEVDRLKQIIQCLQVADFNNLQSLKQNFYSVLMRKEHGSVEKAQTQSSTVRQIVRRHSPMKQTMNQKKIAYENAKKQQFDAKKQQKCKKLHVKKIVRALTEVMDICKEQLIEDITSQNKTYQSRRMFTQLMDRNKTNQTYLELFRTQSQTYEQVISKPISTDLHKQHLSDNQIAQQTNMQTLNIKREGLSLKDKRISQPLLAKRYQKDQKNQNSPNIKVKSKPISCLHRAGVNNAEQKVFTSQKQVAYESQFIQISLKPINNASKQRLPEIYTRATSVETKKNNIIKIIEKEIRNKKKLGDENGQKEGGLNVNSLKEIQVKIKSRQKVQGKVSSELKTIGSNFFEELDKRSTSIYCQTKKSQIC